MKTKTLLLLATAGLLLLPSCKPPEPPKITATDTGKSCPGGQTIKGGDVSLSFAPDGKPLSFTQGNSSNMLHPKNPGPGFYMTLGSGPDAKNIPFTSAESKDGRLILTAEDKTRATFAVNAGGRYISFRLEKLENVPKDSEPVLNFMVNFQSGVHPETVPFDYMCLAGGLFEPLRSYSKASWPYLWQRAGNDPLGGFAFFVPQNDEEHNEALLRIWTEEKVPHPKIDGEWTYERAKEWAEEWKKNAEDTTHLMISAEKPEDLDPLIDYAKKLDAKRVYMHTDTWRGQYWIQDRDSLSVNPKVFPRGEEDLKAFIDKLKANGLGAMMHSLCYGIAAEGSKYMGKGKKTDRRIANWGKGKLEKSISPTDTTILFRPDPGVAYPDPGNGQPRLNGLPTFFNISEILIGDEIIKCSFTDTDQPVWTLKDCKRGVEPAAHEAGTEVVGLLKAYGQNYYPASGTDLPEITAKDYAEFFNRLGVQHHEYDGAECHNDVPWGFPKWAMFVYQNSKLPMTSNTSGGGANPWDLMYRFKKNGADKGPNKGSNHGSGVGTAALALERDSRPATSPVENHFTMGLGAAINSPGYVFGKPEPMFGIVPGVVQQHGLAELIADQFAVWREVAPKLTPELRKQISGVYVNIPRSYHHNAKIVYEARRAGSGFELQPFTILTRGEQDADWGTVQEFGVILPRQYVAPGMRVKMDKPFGRQAPQFIIRVLSGYSDSISPTKPATATQAVSKDLEGYMIGAGEDVQKTEAHASTTPVANAANPLLMQPKAAQMKEVGNYTFTDVGSALEVSLDNSNKEEIFQPKGFPTFAFKGDPTKARGVALTVTGDGSGAFLVVQVGPNKDYVVPIDFTGRKDILIPIGEAARTTGRWGMRYSSKSHGYGPIGAVSIGFGRVMANTQPKVLIENLRMVGEAPSSVKNLTVHAGSGTLTVQGEVKTDQYLWYQGGDSVGVYDLNWHLLQTLPVERKDYEVDKGFNEFWIDGECANPAPWFDAQFITKGEAIPIPAK